MAQTLHLSLSAHPSEAKRLRNELHAWLLEAGINGSTGGEIVLAANEAFVNAVEHPRHRRSREIAIRGQVAEGRVVVSVSDDGRWQEDVDPSRDHFGQLLMWELMSIVRVRRGDAGTTVVLTRRLPAEQTREQP
jgi:anti-sigma regulatory factor (Ser/Thr protein kinase)